MPLSPAPTSPAVSTPATRARCAAPARRPPRHGVAVGAQVGYRDLAGFGRRFIDIDPAELTDDVIYQIGALQALAAASGTTVRYVKPHGALYNAIVHHREQAAAVVDAVRAVDATLPVLGPARLGRCSNSPTTAGLRTVAGGVRRPRLHPRGHAGVPPQPGAVLHDPGEVAARMVRLVTDGVITAVDGNDVTVDRRQHLRARGQPGRGRDGRRRCARPCRTPASRCGAFACTSRCPAGRRPGAAGRDR